MSSTFEGFITAFQQLANASNARLRAAGHKVEAIKPDEAVLVEMHRDGLDARSAFRSWRTTRRDGSAGPEVGQVLCG